MKFRADLAPFNSKVLDDRVSLYFWWEMTARGTYPDFNWTLREEDREYLLQLDNDTLIERHPNALTYWLGATAPSVLDAKHLAGTLLEPQTVLEEAGLQLPKLITMIVSNRGDLSQAFKLDTLSGYLNCLDWWEAHGQDASPRVTWRPPVEWPELLEPIDDPRSGTMPLPRFLALITTERPDLRSAFDLNTLIGRLECLSWWEEHGHREYVRIKWSQPPIGGVMLEPAQAPVDNGPHVPRFLSLIVDERPDLQAAFGPLQSFTGRLNCLSWWLEHGQFQYRAIKWVPPELPASQFEMEWGEHPDWLPVPRFLRLIVEERQDLQALCSLDSFIGRLKCLSWWVEDGESQYPVVHWSAPALVEDLFTMEAGEQCALPLLPRFLTLIRNERPDLQAGFNLDSFSQRLGLLSWWDKDGQNEYHAINWSAADLPDVLEALDDPQSGAMPFPHFLALITAERPDLRSAFDLNTLTGRLACLTWWEQHGHREYSLIKWSPAPIDNAMLEPEQPTVNDGPEVPRFISQIVSERPDLQTFCALDSFIGRVNSLSWWVDHGQFQYQAIHWLPPALSEELLREEPGQQCALPLLPRFLVLLWNARPDLQASFDLDRFSHRLGLISWWDRDGQHEYHAIKWSAVRLSDVLASIDDEQPADESRLPRFLALIASDRADLRSAFDLNTDAGRHQLVAWWNARGEVEYPLMGPLKVRWADGSGDDGDDDEREPARYHARIEGVRYDHGVNVIGFPQGVLGLGEDARMAARVLQLTSTPVALINAPMSGPAKLDHSVDHLISDELKYRISLICLPAPEMVRLALEGGRKLIDAPTHKIGAWPWELPHWPSAFGKVHQMVDEIWAQSRFVQSVYSRLGDTPVYHMPMAVEVPAPMDPNRERFGLPSNEFLFYLMFDGNSWLSRKNPLAGVQAFKQAFGAHSPGVGLVIKAMNVRDDDPVWRAVLELVAGDSRIHIVSERLSRQDSTDFMACCDAYISLHRSEGFGRVIAEAMALGQPVVATNFSGNVDFCEPDTAFLVDGELIPLRAGDYLFSEGQYWCDPDVSVAADQLKRMIDDVPLRERIAQAGKARIERDYSVQAVARAYARRLADITEAKAK